ncbi:MAG: AhpC/TSA family protein [Bacteroidales bacterium]|nr:AhpC/TSA family protein [Bacteroidales bacterium]
MNKDMKKVLFGGLCVILALASCNGKGKTNGEGYLIDGEISDIKDGMVYLKEYQDKNFILVDSAEVEGGKFEFRGFALQTLAYGLTTDKESNNPLVFFLGNEMMKINMSEEKKTLDIEGSPINTLYQETVGKVGKEGFDINEFTDANPASALAPYYIMRNLAWGLDLNQLQTLRSKLDKSLDNNLYVRQMDDLIAKKEAVQVGKIAPNFTLPDPDGKPVSLKDFRGKYVLVSFWAGWCPDCRRENPFIVEAYNKYKNKNFTVLGVSIDRNRETWLNTVEKQGLTWTQVSDLKYWQSDVVNLYAIRWVPTGILLDPDGRILNISLNEDELVKNLASVFEQ